MPVAVVQLKHDGADPMQHRPVSALAENPDYLNGTAPELVFERGVAPGE